MHVEDGYTILDKADMKDYTLMKVLNIIGFTVGLLVLTPILLFIAFGFVMILTDAGSVYWDMDYLYGYLLLMGLLVGFMGMHGIVSFVAVWAFIRLTKQTVIPFSYIWRYVGKLILGICVLFTAGCIFMVIIVIFYDK